MTVPAVADSMARSFSDRYKPVDVQSFCGEGTEVFWELSYTANSSSEIMKRDILNIPRESDAGGLSHGTCDSPVIFHTEVQPLIRFLWNTLPNRIKIWYNIGNHFIIALQCDRE